LRRELTGRYIKETTPWFICFNSKVQESIDLDKIHFKGYAFQIEMKFTAWKHGFNIVEVPIIFTDRSEGTSKMSKGIFREAVLGVIQIKLQSLFRRYSA
jgi:dolichol-phosphate mannosyltransferase